VVVDQTIKTNDSRTLRRRGSYATGWTLAAAFAALLVSVPMIAVGVHVFAPAGDIWRHLVATVLWRYVGNTVALVLGVGALTLVFGVGTAWLVTMCRFPGRKVYEWALLLPLAVPAYAIAFAYGGMMDFAGPVQSALRSAFGWSKSDYWFPDARSLGGAIAVLSFVLYPYVYMLARAAFLEQSVCALEVSRLLGRGPWRSFGEVALPLARPAIFTGLALVLMETLADFGAVQYLAVDTFTTGIFRTWFGLGDHGAAAQLAALLMALVLAVLIGEHALRGRRRFHHTSSRYRPLPGYELAGAAAFGASLACALPVFLGFVLPGGQLLIWAAKSLATLDAAFLRFGATSIALAAAAALVALAVALVLAYGQRLDPTRPMRVAVRVASLGYAIPGSVIAVGVLVPFAAFDNAVDAWMRASFGVSTGLLLSGTVFAMIFAYLVRFLAISFQTVEASLGKVTPSMDRAARTLGATPAETLRRVHMPIIAPSLLTAALLVFVDVMKELPATMILRPFDTTTLAVRAFELASDERLAEASLPALAIVVAGLGPVLLLSLAIARARPGRLDGA
jgi:iron(III) transport system permease protein